MTAKYVCDRCGVEMPNPVVELRVERYAPTVGDFTGDRHLCGECDKRFTAWLGGE